MVAHIIIPFYFCLLNYTCCPHFGFKNILSNFAHGSRVIKAYRICIETKEY